MRFLLLGSALLLLATGVRAEPGIDAAAAHVMERTGARGLAIALIEDGEVTYQAAYGARNAAGDPLTSDTVMYGASLTKAVFAVTMLQMHAEGRLNLDRPIADMLPQPLPSYGDEAVLDAYADYTALAEDERWRLITPRMALSHSTGFANFGFLEEDGRLRIRFQPGSRYGYSGDGMILLQFGLERGLGLELGEEMRRRIFDPLGMDRTSMEWRADFASNLADGWDAEGESVPHDERSRPRAAGSMDTSLADFARFAAAFMRGDLLSEAMRAEMLRPQVPITTRGQFPTLQPELPPEQRRPDLAAGLGVVLVDGPQGPGFFKGGHNDSTGNTWVCVERRRRCVVILSNDVRAERGFPYLVETLLGPTGVPFDWEYGPQDPL
jgi:CubicO group peptidase (beta-lactamase class C family)